MDCPLCGCPYCYRCMQILSHSHGAHTCFEIGKEERNELLVMALKNSKKSKHSSVIPNQSVDNSPSEELAASLTDVLIFLKKF